MRSPFSFRLNLLLGAALCGLLCPVRARADAFSPIPQGDPIYRQLGALTLLGEGKLPKPAPGLTRYEAALQVARVSAVAATKPESLSRSGWRALRDLTLGLRSELRQLGVDVEDVLALCARRLDTSASASVSAPAKGTPTLSLVRPQRQGRGASGAIAPAMPSFLNGQVSPTDRRSWQSGLQLSSLSSHVRVAAALSALQRDIDAPDPFANGGSLALSRSKSSQLVGSDTSVDVDLNSWLRVGARSSRRRLGLDDQTPALTSPLFQGAEKATGLGGVVEVSPVGGLRLSTDFEQISTDVGTSGLRVGGGIGLSAWQNRLTLSAHLSRLQSQDQAFVPSTARELKIGLGLSDRLSLSVLYQGLFSSQSQSSRLAGGLNFRF